MALDPRIALMGQVPRLFNSADAVKLQDMAVNYQRDVGYMSDEQKIRQNQVRLSELFRRDGAINKESGAPEPWAIQEAYGIDASVGNQMEERRNTTLRNMAQAAQQQSVAAWHQSQAKWQEARARSQQTDEDIKIEKFRGTLAAEVRDKALAAYDALKDGDPENAMREYRKAYTDTITNQKGRGVLARARMGDQEIEQALANIPPPEELRKRSETAKEKELAAKARYADPLGLGARRVAVAEGGLSLRQTAEGFKEARGDRALDIREGELERKIIGDERKAGIAEDTIQARNEHDNAFIKLREAEDQAKRDTAQTSAEERERHNRALEEAKTAEKEARTKAYGERAEKASLLRGTPYGARAEKTTLLKMPKETESKIAQANRELEQGKITEEQHDATVANLMNARGGNTVKMSAKEAKFIKANESKLAQMNRELDEGKITQEQHDASIAKLTDIPGNRVRMILKGEKLEKLPGGTIEVGAGKQLTARGYMFDPEGGGLTYIPGGPADPKVIAKQAEARRGAGGGGRTLAQVGSSPTAAGATPLSQGYGKEFISWLKGQNEDYGNMVEMAASDQFNAKDLAASLPKNQRTQFYEDVARANPKYQHVSQKKAAGGIDNETARMVAQRSIAGDDRALIGWGRSTESLKAIARATVDILNENGVPKNKQGEILARQQIQFGAAKRASQAVGQREGMVALGIETASELKPIVLAASDALKRTGWKSLNDLQQAVQRRTASPELRDLEAAINGFKNTYLRTIGGGQIHVEDEKHFDQILASGFSKGDLMSAINMLERELQAEKRAVPKAIGAVQETVKGLGKEAPPKRETPESKMPTVKSVEDAKKLAPGTHFIDPNGVERVR